MQSWLVFYLNCRVSAVITLFIHLNSILTTAMDRYVTKKNNFSYFSDLWNKLYHFISSRH